MIRLMVSLLGIGFVMANPPRLEAQLTSGLPQFTTGLPLDVRVIDETKTLEKTKFNASGGRGETKTLENSYGAELRFTPLEGSVQGIKLRLISFFAPLGRDDKRREHKTGKIQIRDNIGLMADETKRIEFDPETYKQSEYRESTTSIVGVGMNARTVTSTRPAKSGQDYVGVALEVYHNDVLIGVRFDGEGVRKVYEDWLEINSPKPDKPVKKNAGPTLNRESIQVAPPPIEVP